METNLIMYKVQSANLNVVFQIETQKKNQYLLMLAATHSKKTASMQSMLRNRFKDKQNRNIT